MRAWKERVASLRKIRYLLHDRDTKFSASFRETLAAGGVKSLRLPARSPNLNSFAERWVRTVKEECLSKLILFGEGSIRRALREFEVHYHRERNHQGKGNVLLFPCGVVSTRKRGHRSDVTNASAVFSSTTTERPHEFFGYTAATEDHDYRHGALRIGACSEKAECRPRSGDKRSCTKPLARQVPSQA